MINVFLGITSFMIRLQYHISRLRYEQFCILNEPHHGKICLCHANNNDAHQPAHPRSLVSVFIVRSIGGIFRSSFTLDI